jgi:NAD(P)-dependent dehydrogenase (short-subunit alcohol dehydrogenase family)
MSKVWLITGSARGLGRDITEAAVHLIFGSDALHAGAQS